MEPRTERRRHQRKISNIRATCRIGNTEIAAYTHDLSLDGMFLQSGVLIDEGEVFPMGFTLPGEKAPFEGFARVVYQDRLPEAQLKLKSQGMGLEISGRSGRDERVLSAFVARIPSVRFPERLEVVKVTTRGDLERFIDLPFRLYRNDPYWVPPLKKEMHAVLGEENPFLEHGEMDLFTVKDRGTVVGRIAAIVDHSFIDLYKEKVGYFGFFECIPDFEVARRLFDTAAAALRAKGMERIRGPLSPSLNDEICFLAEGFDSPPNIMMPYNPLYYNNFARGYGMGKVKDFFSLWVNLKKELPQGLMDTLKNAENNGVVFRKFDMKHFSRDVELLRTLNNQSWLEAGHWGFVPITQEEMNHAAAGFKKLADPDIIYFAEKGGRPIGYVLNIPNFFPALKQLNGKMHPLGILKFMLQLRNTNNIRLVSIGVIKEFRGMGVAESLLVKSVLEMKRKGFDSLEYSWVLEDNCASIAVASKVGGKKLKRYTMYESPLLRAR